MIYGHLHGRRHHQQRLLAQLALHHGGGSARAYEDLALLAQYCQFAGWLAMDLEEHSRAQRHFLLGLRRGRAFATMGEARDTEASFERAAILLADADCGRRRGLGRRVLAALEQYAREIGYRYIVLDTGHTQDAAH